MKVIDLPEEHEGAYFMCLEEWSDEIKEAGDHKKNWYCKMKDEGLRVKLSVDDKGVVGGMIQYIPAEHSSIIGKDLYFINCIWVHGHKQGRGNFQKRGMGKALLKAAEDDARTRGAKGIAAWGISLPLWMKASWFRKHGFKKVDKDGISVLLWKPFSPDAEPPKWRRPLKNPEMVPGKVAVTAFLSGWCTSMNIVFERARRASAELGDKVAFRAIDTSNRKALEEWGISDALFIDVRNVNTGPPPSYEEIKRVISKRLRKLRRP